jgi:mxaC protein
MNIGVAYPWVLWLLPLSLAPLVFRRQNTVIYPTLMMIPRDTLSVAIGAVQRVVPALLIATLIVAISGLFRPPVEVERIGTGAHIVLLLDRSRSMDQPLGGQPLVYPLGAAREVESKGMVARRVLSDFVASRGEDMFGMVVFSTYPIEVLPLTDKQEVIQAAIQAGNIGRGLSQTDVGLGLIEAVRFFENRPFTGSRIVMLISDGGAKLDLGIRERIKNLLERHRVALYWIYIRSQNSPGISEDVDTTAYGEGAPARTLHEFFTSMKTPYRVYDTENPQAVESAIADVNRLQNLPVHYRDLVPRRDLSGICYGMALVLLLLMIGIKMLEITRWR